MKDVNIYLNDIILKAKTNCKEDITFSGELVFTTSMTGYQEIITDPSFASQIVVMTYPLIGNYGSNNKWNQSDKIYAKGLIVSQIDNDSFSQSQDKENFENFLQNYKTPLIHSIDTRNLVQMIRKFFYPKCVISTLNLSKNEIENHINQINVNVVSEISTKIIVKYSGITKNGKKIGLMDFGVKAGIIEELKNYFEEIIILPHNTPVKDILNLNLNCLMLSNGPGDPLALTDVIKNIKALLGKIDIYGICLGHQLIALSLGYKTKIMPFGHRGGNHPVKNLQTNKVIITTQNHGYEIDQSTIDNNVQITYINLHDKSIEGIKSLKYNAQSVQFHPEASPGPSDAKIVFEDWFSPGF